MTTRALFTRTALVLALLVIAKGASAQEHDAPRVGLGAQYSTLSIDRPGFGGTEHAPGVGARVTYNLTDHFAVEAEGNIHPSVSQADYVTGGDPQQAQFGPFAKARPGIVTFSSVSEVTGYESFVFDGETFFLANFRDTSKTYFSMDLGGVLEFYPSKRILTRFDVGDTMTRYHSRDGPQGFTAAPPPRLPPELRHNLQVTAGIGFRFQGWRVE